MNRVIKKISSQDLSAGALSFKVSHGDRDFKLLGVFVHFSTGVTETVSVNLDSGDGTNYDTVIDSSSLSSGTDYTYTPNGGLWVSGTDQLSIDCTNANTTGVAYATAVIATEADC